MQLRKKRNPDLKWEVRKSFNVGLDFSLWEDRLYGTIVVFNDKTNDLLFIYGIPQPPFLTNQVIANAASAVNKGMEISLGGALDKKAGLSPGMLWETSDQLTTTSLSC
jgi:outer membrane receptor protein involved in Fe transport